MGAVSSDNKKLFIDLSHANEKASAGYYAVKLDKHNIDVSLTTSTRVGCINIL
jgi:putative alpha-1,2-mannosidase